MAGELSKFHFRINGFTRKKKTGGIDCGLQIDRRKAD